METLKSNKFDWKKVVVVSALLILMALVSGLTVWYFAEDMRQEEAERYEEQISALRTEKAELQERIEAIEETQVDVDEEEEVDEDEADEEEPLVPVDDQAIDEDPLSE